MRVRCTKNDAWVTVGTEYLVLGVYGRGTSFKYRRIGDDAQTPALHNAELFALVSSQIPKNWIFRVYPGAEWEITPAGWAPEGFWMAYFDGDATALRVFGEVVSALKKNAEDSLIL